MANQVRIAILASASGARREINSVGNAAEKQSGKLKALGGTLKTVGTLGAVSFATEGIKSSITAATGYQRALKQTEVALRANAGASAQTVASLKERAAAIESTSGALLDENDILAGQQNLLRVGIKGEQAFARATQLTADIAAARGQTFDAASKVVQKALQRPDKAAGALARQGVVLSKVQQDQIKAMTAAGNTAGAQGLIMDALSAKYAGAAKAAGGDSTAGFRRLKDTLADTGRDIAIKLMPAAQQLASFLTNNQTTVLAVAAAVGVLATGALAVSAAMKIASAATAVWSGITKTAAAVQWLMNSALLASPITWIVAGVLALGVGLVLLWKKSQTFRKIITGAFGAVSSAVSSVINFAKRNWPLILSVLGGPIAAAVVLFVKHRDKIFDIFRSIRDGVVGLFKGIAGVITSTLKGAINIAIDLLNKPIKAANAIAGKVPGMPKLVELPHLAQGGIIKARPGGQLVIAGEAGQDEAIIPLRNGRFGAGNVTINLTANITSNDPDDVYDRLSTKLRRDGIGLLR